MRINVFPSWPRENILFPIESGTDGPICGKKLGSKMGSRSLPQLKLEHWRDGCHRVQTLRFFASQSGTFKFVTLVSPVPGRWR